MAEKTIVRPGDELWETMPKDLKGHVNHAIIDKCKRENCRPCDLDVRIEREKGQIPLIRIGMKEWTL